MSDAQTLREEPGVGSYEEYCAIEERVEVIDRRVYEMATPALNHQKILGQMYRQIANQLEVKPCQLFMAQTDVRLPVKLLNSSVLSCRCSRL